MYVRRSQINSRGYLRSDLRDKLPERREYLDNRHDYEPPMPSNVPLVSNFTYGSGIEGFAEVAVAEDMAELRAERAAQREEERDAAR